MTLYGLLRPIWVTLLSRRARRVIWRATPHPLQRLRGRIIGNLESRAHHDEVYDADYFEHFVEPTMARSCDAIARSIVDEYDPEVVVDVGCGTGLLLRSLKAAGVTVLGLENAEAAISVCRQRGIAVEKFDIEREHARGWKADVAVSTEVAEHLPPSCADRFVDLLTSIAKTVVLSAALPGSGGTDHVNEQPNEYWIRRMRSRGYFFDRTLSEQWRRRWRDAGVAGCFARTVMIFVHQRAETETSGAAAASSAPALVGS
jgi:SAM-dependent methyltransferase